MTLKEAKTYFQNILSSVYAQNELLALQQISFEEIFNISQAELILSYDQQIETVQESQFMDAVNQLKKEVPIQYIFGRTEFYDLNFIVDKNVLIPRQETEELVDWIIKENKVGPKLKILDIGTGSGCIILSLARNFPKAECFATDISQGALEIAKQNAKNNNLSVFFALHDILKNQENPFQNRYDIIVSNPPYVLQSEKVLMHKNVLNFEPNLALFVEDEDALIYYSQIASKAKEWLNPGGKLFFEINEQKGKEIYQLLETQGYKDIEIRKDLNSKNRMAKGTLR